MSVIATFEDAGPCLKKLTIEVPAKVVETEIGKIVKKYSRQIQLPGFRVGKVPPALIRKRFRQEIEGEAAESLVPRFWKKAQEEKELDTLLPPQIEDLKIEPGEPMSFVASVEVRPEINIGTLPELDLPEGSTEASEDEIEDALLDLRRQHADWTTVERPAANGDLVVGTILDITDGEDAASDDGDEAPQARPLHVELGGQGVDEELTLALTGIVAGRTTEYSRTDTVQPEPSDEDGEDDDGDDAEPAEPQTIERKFRIAVTEVKEQELPELDDDLAEKFGLESADELQEKFTENLNQRKEQELRTRREKALLDQLRSHYPVTLPERLVQHESEQMMQDYMHRLGSQGIDLQTAPINWDELLGDLKPQAEQRVHERLVLDAVATAQELRLDEKMVDNFLNVAAGQQGVSPFELRQRLSEDGRLEDLRGQMLRDQTVRTLLGEVSDDEDDDGAESPSEEA